MKRKPLITLWILFLFFGFSSSAQNKQEREHRIKKVQFPSEAIKTIAENNKDFKRIKFYKAVGRVSKTYTAKFKKARLFYEMEFNEKGEFNALGFTIKPADIPEESFGRINQYLSQKFEKSKVRKMIQNYPLQSNGSAKKIIKKAFQNLMLPDIVYEFLVKGKKDGTRADFEITFDSEGNFIQIREALPTNFDRVLY